jgi:hypothetical protein
LIDWSNQNPVTNCDQFVFAFKQQSPTFTMSAVQLPVSEFCNGHKKGAGLANNVLPVNENCSGIWQDCARLDDDGLPLEAASLFSYLEYDERS